MTQTDSATARYAADAALANAEKQITANILSSAQPNPYNLGLLVSTNFINSFGFAPGFTNVNYDYDTTGASLTPDEFLQNLTNLFYDPRPPVFIPTNGTAGGYDFRFYLDLNRNGVYDTNGFTGDFDANGYTGTGSFKVGDPEWIGVLEHPDQPYGPNNHFVARYAFIALPVGDALDLNAIHNQTLQENSFSLVMANDGYFRNQGVGSWELNLAAFLADLNTNEWGMIIGSPVYYEYNQPSSPNLGVAFQDAFSILTNRYAGGYNTLVSVQNLFGANGATAFQNDNIDGYGDGPLQTTTAGINESIIANQDIPSLPWAGANNTNHFFYLPSELFDSAESSAGFVQRLTTASAGADTYDRYTFYRLLSQLGTDSDPESGRMNLNYDNLDAFGNVVPGAETNFIPWTPLRFFTNAADRMLREYSAEWATIYATNLSTGFVTNGLNTNFVATFNGTNGAPFYVTNAFGITNIPVWVNGKFVYTPAVQRVLQLAANVYDATTNNSSVGSPDWPDAFRPLFSSDANGNVFITGYTNVTTMSDPTTDPQLLLPVDVSSISGSNVLANVYGVPWIIGAKKGLPNFNAFSMQSVFQITRKLQFTRSSTNVSSLTSPNSYTLSQQLTLALTNSLGIEFWNSYSSNFTANNLQVWIYDTNYLVATNDEGAVYNNGMSAGVITNLTLWPGAGNISLGVNPHSFIVPLNTNFWALPMSVYQFGNLSQPFNTNLANAGPNPTFYTNYLQPQWTLLMTNRLRVVILDEDAAGNYHVLDYVQLSGPDATLTNQFVTGLLSGANGYGLGQWEVNSNNGIPYGFFNQVQVSADNPHYYPNYISE
ncbi:MAG TPA: hypothetical protein VKJ65_06970, partial [Phycisphaerae bacterium]|nr:hypothetical protein [Phycisphaerae bacterium]